MIVRSRLPEHSSVDAWNIDFANLNTDVRIIEPTCARGASLNKRSAIMDDPSQSLGRDGLNVMYKTFSLTFQTLLYGECIQLTSRSASLMIIS